MKTKTSEILINKCVNLRVKDRLSIKAIMAETGLSRGTVHKYIKDFPLSPQEIATRAGIASGSPENKARRHDAWKKKVQELGFDHFRYERRRLIVIEEQQGSCNHCNRSEWMGRPICLEIDHINGDNKDHRRENMEAICPNCHSLTDTWRGRNKRSVKAVSDQDLINAISESPSIYKALIKVGLTPKGGELRQGNSSQDRDDTAQ